MDYFQPISGQKIPLFNWDLPECNSWTFRNIRRLFPTAEVARGNSDESLLTEDKRNLNGLKVFDRNGQKTTIDGFLAETFTNGFIVLHQGKIVFEQYRNGFTQHDTHLSQSVAKSLVGTLAGVLIGEGVFSEQDLIVDIVPQLNQSGYADARVEHILSMTSGVRFIEDYFESDPSISDVAKIDIACGWKPKHEASKDYTSLYDIATELGKSREHGAQFVYRSIETDVLSWVIESVTKRFMPDLLSEKIWSKLGAQQDAYFALDRSGTALADGGFCATLRDYARFAQMHLNGGEFNGLEIVPNDWVMACRKGDHSVFNSEPFISQMPNGAYHNQWWIKDVNRSIYMARGIFGQLIYIDPDRQFVAVKLSTWPEPANSNLTMDTLAVLDGLSQAM
ncbi:MAG: beta-lactamase family protein [Gammaproteobacteria bacterium]|nr:beta-lactamase family protein [Gammaproteobacteria bacterium]